MNEYKKSVSSIEFLKLTDAVVNDYYSLFFDSLNSLISEIEERVINTSVEEILKKLEDIQAEVQQIYYKEKLILFPFLIKNYSENGLIEKPQSIVQITAEISKVAKKIKTFESGFCKIESITNSQNFNLLQSKLNDLSRNWDYLFDRKNELFNTFGLKKIMD